MVHRDRIREEGLDCWEMLATLILKGVQQEGLAFYHAQTRTKDGNQRDGLRLEFSGLELVTERRFILGKDVSQRIKVGRAKEVEIGGNSPSARALCPGTSPRPHSQQSA